MDSFEMSIVLLILVSLLPMTGAIIALTPWLMKQRECFAVTIPESAQANPQLRSLKVRYSIVVAVATIILSAVCAWLAIVRALELMLTVYIVGMLALAAGSFALMLVARRKVQMIKREQGWSAEAQIRSAVVLEREIPWPLSLKWNIVYVPIMLVTLAMGVAGYSSLPDMVPMHADLYGNIDAYEPKGVNVILFPVLIQLFLAVCMTFAHWSILKSKKNIDPEAPAASALGYGLFARAQSVLLFASGVVLTAGIGITFQLSSLEVIRLGQSVVIVLLLCAPILVGSVVLSLVYGQSGARAVKRLSVSDELLADDDAYWKLGVFYFNPDDPALFVPERFGIGWTCNFARPSVWVIVGVGALVIILFSIALFVLV